MLLALLACFEYVNPSSDHIERRRVLTQAELQTLFRDQESDRVERTESNVHDKIRQAICAFANDLPNHQMPGVIFIGQRDDRSCANLAITDHLLTDIGGLRSDGVITPFPTMSVSRVVVDGCTVAAVIVAPSDNPPVVSRHSIFAGGAVKAFQRWLDRIPEVYRDSVETNSNCEPGKDDHRLARLKDYRSLIAMAQEARKPMFLLKPADGAIGGHQQAVQSCYTDFRNLALEIQRRIEGHPANLAQVG